MDVFEGLLLRRGESGADLEASPHVLVVNVSGQQAILGKFEKYIVD